MSFYPILSAPGCSGQTTVYNFAPNNWEKVSKCTRLVNLTWASDGAWHSIVLTELPFGSAETFSRKNVCPHLPADILPLLSLSKDPLPRRSTNLPSVMHSTAMPNWRATLSLHSGVASTSYQGELDPFPDSGSLLTFAPFIQFGSKVENFMLFVNLENSPLLRTSALEVHDSAEPSCVKQSIFVRNNSISAISLDDLYFGSDTLPIISSKGMAGIPLFFSKTSDGSFLSIEHTHPPASYVIHGERWGAQKAIKKKWFDKLA